LAVWQGILFLAKYQSTIVALSVNSIIWEDDMKPKIVILILAFVLTFPLLTLGDECGNLGYKYLGAFVTIEGVIPFCDDYREQKAKINQLKVNLSELSAEINALSRKNESLERSLHSLENRKLDCRAKPTEEGRDFKTCARNEYELMRWCSGDCSSDDAKVTICCR
jgi:outer membrane murein-binding lipoprotein Lpp